MVELIGKSEDFKKSKNYNLADKQTNALKKFIGK